MNRVFINNAFSKAMNDYLSSNTNVKGVVYNSFLVVVIRMLICLYGELDIVNPMYTNDVLLLKDNLGKFGFSKTDIELFFSNMQLYYDLECENEKRNVKVKNPYFIVVQKMLVDMLICKKMQYFLTDTEVNEFYDLLYTPYSMNPLRVSYNFLMAKDTLEIDNYFKMQMKNNVKNVLPSEKNFLNVKAYEILNINVDDLKNMDSLEVDKINTQVFDFFKIRENAINKEYLLEKAIEAWEKENNKVTSGNGYVDILIVLSIISTVVMLVGIVAFVIV